MTTTPQPLAYDDTPSAADACDLAIRQNGGRLAICWPAESTRSRYVSLAIDCAQLVFYAGIAGLLPRVVAKPLVGTNTGVAWMFLPVLIVNGFFAASGVWKAARHPSFRDRLIVHECRMTLARMGMWSPRVVDRPLADVTRLEWALVRRPFRRRPDTEQLTIHSTSGEPIRLAVAAKAPRVPAAARAALAAVLPGR